MTPDTIRAGASLRPYHRPAWTNRSAIIIGGGWSITDEQLQRAHAAQAAGLAHVVVVNNTAERAPWADVVYFGDYTAIKHYRPKLERACRGEWVTACRSSAERWRLTHLKPANTNGLSLQRVQLNGNSGAQAIGVAACFGARRILLVGFDMRNEPGTGRAHWFGQHPAPLVRTQLFDEWLQKFEAIARDAEALGVQIINCTSESALRLFPLVPIDEAL